MRLWNTVEFTHVTLGLVPEILDAVDVVVAVCKQRGMIDAEVVEIRDIQHVITSPAVRIDNAVGDNFALNNRDQRRRGSVRDNLGVNLPTPF